MTEYRARTSTGFYEPLPSSSETRQTMPQPDLFSFSYALRQYFKRELSFKQAILEPAKLFTSKAFRNKQFANRTENLLDDLTLETISTWLLVEILFDPMFSPFNETIAEEQNQPQLSAHIVCEMLKNDDLCNHLARALCWMRLEHRKKLYLEQLTEKPPVFLTPYTGSQINNQTGSVRAGESNRYLNRESLYQQCVRYITAGMDSVVEDLVRMCDVSHLAAPIHSSRIPPLNLIGLEGRDFYKECMPEDSSAERMQLDGRELNDFPVNVTKVAKRHEDENDAFRKWKTISDKNDAQFGIGNHISMMEGACWLKASQAIYKGFRHEYEFHCLMSGKKRKEDLLCSYDWHSQMYVPIFMHLRERLSRELKNNTEPFQLTMNLENVLSDAAQEIYLRGCFINGPAASQFESDPLEDLEQCFLKAASMHQSRLDFEDFFRTFQASLILKNQSNLLCEFGDLLRNVIERATTTNNPSEKELCQTWIMTVANLLILLIHEGHISKRAMFPTQLSTLDAILECVLTLLLANNQEILIPMYACHLTIEGQDRWYCTVMRRIGEIAEPNMTHWFLEGMYWLETWDGLHNPVFRRPDRQQNGRFTMLDVILSNIEKVDADFSLGYEAIERALKWIEIGHNSWKGQPDGWQSIANLCFSLYSELVFFSLQITVRFPNIINSVFSFQPNQKMPMYNDVSIDDLLLWVKYCTVKGECEIFLSKTTRNAKLSQNAPKPGQRNDPMDMELDEVTDSELEYGFDIYQKGLEEIILADFFFQPIFLPTEVEKHTLQFVIGKQGNDGFQTVPFNDTEISTITEFLEVFINEVFACHEGNACCRLTHKPYQGFITIQLEFKREALSTNTFSLVTSFMKGQSIGMKNIAICQVVAPLSVQKYIANVRAKAVLFHDLFRIQQALYTLFPRHLKTRTMENIFRHVLRERCEFFEEEGVLDESEITTLLKEQQFVLKDLVDASEDE